MTAKKKKKGGGIFWKLLFLVALCVFCFSMYQLVNIYLGYKKGVDEYHTVAEKSCLLHVTGELTESTTGSGLPERIPIVLPGIFRITGNPLQIWQSLRWEKSPIPAISATTIWTCWL